MENKNSKIKNIATVIFLVGMLLLTGYISYVAYSYSKVSIGIGIFVVMALICFGLYKLSKKHFKVSTVIEVILIALLALGANTVHTTDSIVNKTIAQPEYETVCIAAMKDSGIKSSDDFSHYRIGYINSEGDAYKKCSELLKENNKRVQRTVPKRFPKTVYEDLKNGKLQLMLLTDRMRASLDEIDPDYEKKIKILLKKDYIMKEVVGKPVDITKEPFVIYLQGSDASSLKNIHSTGRGDANFLVTINPKTKKANLQVIPRDTYVNIPSMGGHSKLSYSGMWGGVQSSIESIEEKFNIDINYYAKINWNGVVKLVDGLGGVNVDSQYDFNSNTYSFHRGYNQLNGNQALAFVTERKSLPENELSRGKNQMAMIKAVINKFAKNPNFDDAMLIMNSMADSFVTNVPKKDYINLFNVAVNMLPELKSIEPKTMDGSFEWKTDEVNGEYKYYFYPAKGEVERVRKDIESLKAN